MMDHAKAEQIARLLNTQNQLTVQYTADRVLGQKNNYLVRLDDTGVVSACAELKKVQWYQYELLHVTVSPQHKRQGLGRSLVTEAEERARAGGARILQSTIRVGNEESERLFTSLGFRLACRFYNERSKNTVGVWQRILSPVPL